MLRNLPKKLGCLFSFFCFLSVPLCSAKRALRFAGTTLVKAAPSSGLRTNSVALVFQCRVIDRTRICEKMGAISQGERSAIFDEPHKLTGQSG
jgi:mRNA-degrading endonuclease toxin of MazEF toxin-antitoxin module